MKRILNGIAQLVYTYILYIVCHLFDP